MTEGMHAQALHRRFFEQTVRGGEPEGVRKHLLSKKGFPPF